MMKVCFVVIFGVISFSMAAFAADDQPIVITLQNHTYTPSEVHFPSNKAVVLLVKNNDAQAEEFECGALQIEKVIPAHGQGLIHVRPTPHGHFTFVGEYHEKVARGVLIAD